MSKTKIVVLHMKELIYTGIFAALGILFIALLIMMFLPGKKDSDTPAQDPSVIRCQRESLAFRGGKAFAVNGTSH